MLKRILFSLLVVASIHSFILADDAWMKGKYGGPSEMLIFKSTDMPGTAGAVNTLGTSILDKIVISSPSAVDLSTWSVLNIYNSTGPSTDLRATIQLSSNVYGADTYYEWDMGLYLGKGFAFSLSTGDAALSDIAGKVTAIYKPQLQPNYRVFSSSFVPADTSTHTLAVGPAVLHRVSVLKAATGSPTVIRINNSSHTALTYGGLAEKLSIDPSVIGEYSDLNVLFSSGITFNEADIGTAGADVMFFFKSRAPNDWQRWDVFHATGALTNFRVFAGPGVVHAIFNGKVGAADHFTVYDSSDTAERQIATVDGGKITTKPIVLNANVREGLTVSNLGTTAEFSVMYRRSQ